VTIRLGTNIASLGAQRRLGDASQALERTYERLSSGMRINRASDDAAGMAIATSLRSDSRIYSQGIRNISDGISALSIAEGAVSSLSGMTIRMKELASQSANGTYGRTQRESLNNEAQALIAEFNRITATTTFNGRQLLDGSAMDLIIQAGGSQLKVGSGVGLSRKIGTGQISLLNSATFSSGTRYSQLGDINGDGIADMILGSGAATSDVRYAIGNGDGTFQSEQSLTHGYTDRVSLADVNQDGKLDIVGTGNGSGIFYVSLGNGNGTFSAAINNTISTSLPAGDDVLQNMTFADVNGDGILDAIGGANNSAANHRMYIAFGNGNGTFRSGLSFNVGLINIASVARVGDINGDGKSDILINSNDNNYVFFGNGNGTFSGVTTIAPAASSQNGSFLLDINNDGRLDIVTSVSSGSGNISIQIGNGDGTFKTGTLYSGGGDSSPMDMGDINGDGIIDILVRDVGGSVVINFGNGDGTFRGPITRSVLSGDTVRLVDINNDGVSEIIVRGVAGTQLGIYNQSTNSTGAIQQFNILTQENARSVLSFLDTVQDRIGRENSWLGSYQSRLRTAANNLYSLRENYMAAESRISDVDVAQETSALIRTQILQQAAASILAQANQQPQLALSLLR
jgi:flagellin